MEAIASSQGKNSGKGRTIVEGWRSQWLRAERRFHCFVDSGSNHGHRRRQVVPEDGNVSRIKDHLLECPRH
jgi:hypothetical protein